jgi:NAD(P)-dependent dehydrogenase (short-subunit alcohol dehydrogenase family)
MIERRWGRVVTIGSVQQNVPHPEMLIYGAAKAAQHHMVRNLARVVGPHGVTVNNLAPGVIETERNAAALADPDRCEACGRRSPPVSLASRRIASGQRCCCAPMRGVT